MKVRTAGHARARGVTPAESAWIAVLPCALVTIAAIVVLGPPIGHAAFSRGSDALWPRWWASEGQPEPVEEGRYLLALLAPLMLVAAMRIIARRRPVLPDAAIRSLTLAGQLAVLAFLVAAVLGRHSGIDPPRILELRTALVAAALVLATIVALRGERVADAVMRLVRDTTARRVVTLILIVALSASCVLQAVTTDRLVEDAGQMNWTLNDVFAVLNGRTSLVDYHVMYAKLLPYPTALALVAFGKTALVYTIVMAVLSGLALVAVYAVFRRLTRSSLLALGLFVPFLIVSEFEHPMRMPAMWPNRYGNAFLLAWLTVRQLDGSRPRRPWILFFVGGLLAIDSLEFGAAALLGTVAALLCQHARQPARSMRRLAIEAVVGVAAAGALVSAFTFARAGRLPDPLLLLEWPRTFSRLGYLSIPMSAIGLHLVLYATFVAAIALAVARLSKADDDDPLLTSVLAWSGVFGLVAGSYYVGRSEHFKLLSLLSTWGFALAPLTIASVRSLAARGWRRPALSQLLVLLAFAYSLCSIGELSTPWRQLDRLTTPMPDPTYRRAAEQFVGQRTRTGETVGILLPEGARIAYNLGLENVAPYPLQNAVVTREQLRLVIDTFRREGVRHVFLPIPGSRLASEGDTAMSQLEPFRAAGFPVREYDGSGFLELGPQRPRDPR